MNDEEKINPQKINISTYQLTSIPMKKSEMDREKQYKERLMREAKSDFKVCCNNTRDFIQGAVDLGITKRELTILKETLHQHPLDRFGRNRYEDKESGDIDLEGLIDEVLEISTFFNSKRVKEYFLSEFYNLVQKENTNPGWSIILEKFNKKWHAKIEELTKEHHSSTSAGGKENKINILFLGTTPIDTARLRVDKEFHEIENGIQLAELRNMFVLKSKWAVTTKSLQQAFLREQPSIVHFSGHGAVEGIMVEDELGRSKLIDNNALGALFELFSEGLQCVVLNSCYSESQANEILNHVPYVIGMKSSVPDNAAIAFSIGFYSALGAGKDFEFAYNMGVVSIKLEGIAGSDIPILLKR